MQEQAYSYKGKYKIETSQWTYNLQWQSFQSIKNVSLEVYLTKFLVNVFHANKLSIVKTVTKTVVFPAMMEEPRFKENVLT